VRTGLVPDRGDGTPCSAHVPQARLVAEPGLPPLLRCARYPVTSISAGAVLPTRPCHRLALAPRMDLRTDLRTTRHLSAVHAGGIDAGIGLPLERGKGGAAGRGHALGGGGHERKRQPDARVQAPPTKRRQPDARVQAPSVKRRPAARTPRRREIGRSWHRPGRVILAGSGQYPVRRAQRCIATVG